MKIVCDGEVTCILIPSKFDTLKSSEVEAGLLKVVNSGAKKILCDFSKTEYISSSGLRVILSIAKKLQRNGGKIVLSSIKPFVYDVFKIAAFDKIFNIYETKAQALKVLS